MTLVRASTPEIKANAGIYIVSWPDLKVQMRVDRLYDDSHFNTTAEVTTTLHFGSTVGHLDRSRLNMTSSTAKRSFAKAMMERNDIIPWSDMVEQLCVKVLDLHRQGVPPVILGNVKLKTEALSWRIKPIILEGQPNLIHAHGGTGKSMFAEFLALLVQTPIMRKEGVIDLEVEPGNVLYLDWETDEETIRRRQLAMSRGFGTDEFSKIVYQRMTRPLARDIEYVQRTVLENNINFVVADSLVGGTGNDMNTDQYINAFFDALRTLNCTSLTVHHDNREKQMYGNNYIWNRVRSVWALKQGISEDKYKLSLGLFNEKISDGGRSGGVEPLTFEADFNGDTIRWKRTKTGAFNEAANEGPGQSTKSRILETIKRAPQGKIGPSQIAELLDLDPAQVRARLRDLKQDGKVVLLPGDQQVYGLPTE